MIVLAKLGAALMTRKTGAVAAAVLVSVFVAVGAYAHVVALKRDNAALMNEVNVAHEMRDEAVRMARDAAARMEAAAESERLARMELNARLRAVENSTDECLDRPLPVDLFE